MAATKGATKISQFYPYEVEETYYTTLEPGATVTHTYANASDSAPIKVDVMVTQRPTSRDVLTWAWDESANVPASKTIALQFDTVAAGDLAGAQVKVLIYFNDMAGAGYTY